MKRAHQARAARNDGKDAEDPGANAIYKCEGLWTCFTANATYAKPIPGSEPDKSRSEPFKTDDNILLLHLHLGACLTVFTGVEENW